MGFGTPIIINTEQVEDKNPDVYIERAKIKYATNDYQGAIVDINKAIKLYCHGVVDAVVSGTYNPPQALLTEVERERAYRISSYTMINDYPPGTIDTTTWNKMNRMKAEEIMAQILAKKSADLNAKADEKVAVEKLILDTAALLEERRAYHNERLAMAAAQKAKEAKVEVLKNAMAEATKKGVLAAKKGATEKEVSCIIRDTLESELDSAGINLIIQD